MAKNSNKKSGKKAATPKKTRLSDDTKKITSADRIIAFDNPINFKESKYSVQYHDIKIFIQGVDVSPFLTEELTIETSVNGNGSLRFKLDNAGDKFTMTSDNMINWTVNDVVNGNGVFSYRKNVEDKQQALDQFNKNFKSVKDPTVELGNQASKVLNAFGVRDLAKSVKKRTQDYSKEATKNVKDAFYSERDRIQDEVDAVKQEIQAAPLTINDVYTEMPKARIYAYKMGTMFSSIAESLKYVSDVLEIEDIRYDCADKHKSDYQIAKKKSDEGPQYISTDSIANLMNEDPVAYAFKVREIEIKNKKIKKEWEKKKKELDKIKNTLEDCSSGNTYDTSFGALTEERKLFTYFFMVFKGLPKKVFHKVNWGQAKSDILAHAIDKFVNPDKRSDPAEVSRITKIFNFALIRFKKTAGKRKIGRLSNISKRSYKNTTILKSVGGSTDRLNDTDTGERMWAFGVSRPVFHRHDPVRVFVHNPYSSYDSDEWIPKFTGYLKDINVSTGMYGESQISLECYDIKGLMDRMRFQTGRALYLIVPIIRLGNKKYNLFNTSFAAQKTMFNTPFKNLSISDVFDLVIIGKSFGRNNIITSPIGNLRKGYTVYYPDKHISKAKPLKDDVKVFDLEFLQFKIERITEAMQNLKDIQDNIYNRFNKFAESFLELDVLKDTGFSSADKEFSDIKYNVDTARAELKAIIADRITKREAELKKLGQDASNDKMLSLYKYYFTVTRDAEKYLKETDKFERVSSSDVEKYRKYKELYANAKNSKDKKKYKQLIEQKEAAFAKKDALNAVRFVFSGELQYEYIAEVDKRYAALSKKLKKLKADEKKLVGQKSVSREKKRRQQLLSKWHYLTLFGVLPQDGSISDGQYANELRFKQRLTEVKFDEFKPRLLTEEEVNLIGYETLTDGTWAPDRSFLHTLLPPGGSGGSGTGLVQYRIDPGADVRTFKTRLAILNEFSDLLDYKWYVSPIGDIIFEFPFYDFYPEDFGDIENLFKVEADVIDESMGEELGDIHTALVLHGGHVNEDAQGSMIKDLPKLFQPRAYVWCPILMPRLGYKDQVLQYGFISSNRALGGLGIVKFQKKLLDANKWSLNMIAREGLGLNRPMYNFMSLRMGVTESVSYAYSFEGAQTMNLGLTAVRRLRSDRTFRFISGGAHMPINYSKILSGKYSDLKAYARANGIRIKLSIYTSPSNNYGYGKGSSRYARGALKADKKTSAASSLSLMKKAIKEYLPYKAPSGKTAYLNIPYPKPRSGAISTSPTRIVCSKTTSLGGDRDCYVLKDTDCGLDVVNTYSPKGTDPCRGKKYLTYRDRLNNGLGSTHAIFGYQMVTTKGSYIRKGFGKPTASQKKNYENFAKKYPTRISKIKAPGSEKLAMYPTMYRNGTKYNGYLKYLKSLSDSGDSGGSNRIADEILQKLSENGVNNSELTLLLESIAQTRGISGQQLNKIYNICVAIDSTIADNPTYRKDVSKATGLGYSPLLRNLCPERAAITHEPLHALESAGNDFFICIKAGRSVLRSQGQQLYNIYKDLVFGNSLDSTLATEAIYTDPALRNVGSVKRTIFSLDKDKSALFVSQGNVGKDPKFGLIKQYAGAFGGILNSGHFFGLIARLRYPGILNDGKISLYERLGTLWWANRLLIVTNLKNGECMVGRVIEHRPRTGTALELSYNNIWALGGGRKTGESSGSYGLTYFLNGTTKELESILGGAGNTKKLPANNKETTSSTGVPDKKSSKNNKDVKLKNRKSAAVSGVSPKFNLLRILLMYATTLDGSFNIYDRTKHAFYDVHTCPFVGSTVKDARSHNPSPVNVMGLSEGSMNSYFASKPAVAKETNKKSKSGGKPPTKKK